ncbi:MAG: phage tail protein [Oxalobacteraceae bacterium]|nr:phage tail protein [Oxalobacteraceae bacterium]
MSILGNEPISLLIGGRAHQEWESYRIDSDLLSPADDWSMTASFNDAAGNTLPDFIYEGATAKVMLGDDILLDGLVDAVDHVVERQAHYFELYGRDRASLLLDCSAPLLSLQLATLEQIIAKAVLPLGIKAIDYRAKPSAPRQKVHTEPGQSVWEWLMSACEANQVWPWFTPDGTLVIGAPDYTTAPVADLILRFNGDGNNVKSIQRVQSIQQSFSEITVLGQSAGDGDVGHHNIKGVATDDTMPLYRPRIVIDGNCESSALASRRAGKLIADSRMARDRLTVKVDGHRVATSGSNGQPWTPGMRVHVLSEPHRIDAVYFLIRRTFTRSRSAGPCTDLHLIPDGTWLLNVPFIKAKRRSSYGKKKGHYAEGNN